VSLGGYSACSYRYGFQGQETDDEVRGEGNSVNYKYRMHDPRVGRFFATDPLEKQYPQLTPYQFSSNIPISMIELEGLEGVSIVDHTTKTTTVLLNIYVAVLPDNHSDLTDAEKEKYKGAFTRGEIEDFQTYAKDEFADSNFQDENHTDESGTPYKVNFQFNFIESPTAEDAKQSRLDSKDFSSSVLLKKMVPDPDRPNKAGGASRGFVELASLYGGHSALHEFFHNLVHHGDNIPEDIRDGFDPQNQRWWHDHGKYGGGIFQYALPQLPVSSNNVKYAIEHTANIEIPEMGPYREEQTKYMNQVSGQ